MKTSSTYIAFILLTVLLSNCGSNETKQAENTTADTAIQQPATGPAELKLRGLPISFYLAHEHIPQVCKDIYTGKRALSNDKEVLTLIDSMFTLNDETKPFYYLTVTRTMEKADGAYADALGVMAKSFVETRTREFLNYNINEPLITEKDYEEWVNTVVGEIKVCAEGYEKEMAVIMKKNMEKNCVECDEQQKAKLNDFATRVEKQCL